jgi:hypothetical protein
MRPTARQIAPAEPRDDRFHLPHEVGIGSRVVDLDLMDQIRSAIIICPFD